MKKLILLFALAIVANVSYGQQVTATMPPTQVNTEVGAFDWDAQAFDFGKIKQGVPISHEFKFTNKGKVPLVITNVQPSCGCTTPDWTKDPIPVGGQGFIKATYNAAAMGAFNKSITVNANIETGFMHLTFNGEVIAAEVPKN